MNEREKIIRLWFDMWIKKADLGIDNIFTDDVVYTESWSPKYENRKTVKHWFDEWNTRGSSLYNWDSQRKPQSVSIRTESDKICWEGGT